MIQFIGLFFTSLANIFYLTHCRTWMATPVVYSYLDTCRSSVVVCLNFKDED